MADYIEREKVAELIDYYTVDYFEAEAYFGLLKEDFQQLPSADVSPVVRGKWICHDDELLGLTTECSVCHVEGCLNGHYCPNCGAKMDLLN